jgi:hypothetical protein
MSVPVSIRERVLAAGVGILLSALAVIVTAQWNASGLAVVFGVGGIAMLLYAVAGNRIKSVGPKGVELRKLTEEIVKYGSRPGKARNTLTSTDQAEDPDRRRTAAAAAAIRAAETPEELLGTLRGLNTDAATRDGD